MSHRRYNNLGDPFKPLSETVQKQVTPSRHDCTSPAEEMKLQAPGYDRKENEAGVRGSTANGNSTQIFNINKFQGHLGDLISSQQHLQGPAETEVESHSAVLGAAPYLSDRFSAEPHLSDRFSSEPHLSDRYPAEPHLSDRYPAEPHLSDRYPAEPHLSDRYPAEPHLSDRCTAEPQLSDRCTAEPHLSDRYTAEPHLSDRYPAEPHLSDRYTAEPHLSDRYTAEPHLSDRYTAEPHLSDRFTAGYTDEEAQFNGAARVDDQATNSRSGSSTGITETPAGDMQHTRAIPKRRRSYRNALEESASQHHRSDAAASACREAASHYKGERRSGFCELQEPHRRSVLRPPAARAPVVQDEQLPLPTPATDHFNNESYLETVV